LVCPLAVELTGSWVVVLMQVYEAAQVAHIHSHLTTFPQGYSTRVGE
jgi:ABC-type transport system involved in Fe-S cluster assembly fused permease/ATPase subunit